MLNYEEFKDTIASQIKDYLPVEYSDSEVTINSVLKNNSAKLDGLIIKKTESNICPNIYLNQYDIVNIGLHFFLKNVRPYAASCSEA